MSGHPKNTIQPSWQTWRVWLAAGLLLSAVVGLKFATRSWRETEPDAPVAAEQVVDRATAARAAELRIVQAASRVDELTGNMLIAPDFAPTPPGTIIKRPPFIAYVLGIGLTNFVLGFITAVNFGFRPRPLLRARRRINQFIAEHPLLYEYIYHRLPTEIDENLEYVMVSELEEPGGAAEDAAVEESDADQAADDDARNSDPDATEMDDQPAEDSEPAEREPFINPELEMAEARG